MRKFKILLTNDDGLHSNGMKHLIEELEVIADVWAVAPDRERSATSQAISIRDTMRLVKVSSNKFMLTGFPADCVNVALHSSYFPAFDLVISGINHGVNLGDDVFYSGTVGAARHAAIHHIKAIAVSCPITDVKSNFHRAASYIRHFVLTYFQELKKGIVYNINYPLEEENHAGAFPEAKITFQGKREYFDRFEAVEEGVDYSILKLTESVLGHKEEVGSDFHALYNGFISITPLGIQSTHQGEFEVWTNLIAKH